MGCCCLSTNLTEKDCFLLQPSGLAIYKHQTLQQNHLKKNQISSLIVKNLHQVKVGYFF